MIIWSLLVTFGYNIKSSKNLGMIRPPPLPVFSDHIQGQLLPNISSQIQIVLIWGAPYKAKSLCPNMGYPISGQTDFVPIRAGRGRWDLEQTVFFGVFIEFFVSLFCFSTVLKYMTGKFRKENGHSLLFVAEQATETKFRRSTEVTIFPFFG